MRKKSGGFLDKVSGWLYSGKTFAQSKKNLDQLDIFPQKKEETLSKSDLMDFISGVKK